MSIKTVSEKLFEDFCATNNIVCEKIKEDSTVNIKTPDYKVIINGLHIVFEIKQLDKDVRHQNGSWSLNPGELIRKVITKKNSQVKEVAKNGFPTVLLIYNNFDQHFHTLGTDQHDFIAAMYGELSILINKASMKVVDSFHGKNSKCHQASNTSFSAIGGIYKTDKSIDITIYENKYAKVPLNYTSLPSCINAHRIQITNG